jgi:anti-anti-sigma factor
LEIRTLQEGGVRVLAAAGDVVVETAPVLEAALAAAAVHDDLVLDLTAVPFMDSTGLRVVLTARNDALAAGRRLILVVAPDGQVEGLLDFTELKDRVPTAPSRGHALASLGPRD